MPITVIPSRVRTELARGAPTYAIPPLRWHKLKRQPDHNVPGHVSNTPVCTYAITPTEAGLWTAHHIAAGISETIGTGLTDRGAKAACQQHWRELMQACLVRVTP